MVRIIIFLVTSLWAGILGCAGQVNVVSELKHQIEIGNSKAILQAASDPENSQKSDFKEFLRDLASDSNQRVSFCSAACYAHIGLARLGDQEALQQIAEETAVNKPSYLVGMQKLFRVGGKEALKQFYSLLDDATQIVIDENCENKSGLCGDVFYYPKNVMVVFYLSQLVSDPPTLRGVPSKNIAAWKKWFIDHPDVLQ